MNRDQIANNVMFNLGVTEVLSILRNLENGTIKINEEDRR